MTEREIDQILDGLREFRADNRDAHRVLFEKVDDLDSRLNRIAGAIAVISFAGGAIVTFLAALVASHYKIL